MKKRWLMVLGIAALVVGSGCRGMAPPNWFRPGPAEYQQSQAERFDPYPENETGPKIAGARPPEYEKPPAEVLRVQPPVDPLRGRGLPWSPRW